MTADIARHQAEIQRNLSSWRRKPILRRLYKDFYGRIAQQLASDAKGSIVEIGSGIGAIKEVIPDCVCTDLFRNPWIDRVENCYRLSWPDESVSNLILFDVFHHLRYPGTALREFRRVLTTGGRVIIFEPCVSLVGRIVWGLFHQEPLGLGRAISWLAPDGWSPSQADYYAAQGNATRIFFGQLERIRPEWAVVNRRRFADISYVLSGGYSNPQLYPDAALPMLRLVDRVCDLLPAVFATRLLVVLEKRAGEPQGNAAETRLG